ncbi:hypothetical protein JW766_06085 [Candidatus Dojkabacteria bacterium]|nr:hypothetical protein [Candidatus Dojkabacteria bacterium]
MSKTPSKFIESIIFLSKRLKNTTFAFRGTTSLVIQGIDMNVDDIDILCNKKAASQANKLLHDYCVVKVSYKESDKFKSYYGKFKINGIQVEVMGEWQIRDSKGNWSDPFNASKDTITFIQTKGQLVPVTRIETELKMFSLMGRWNAFHKIKKQVTQMQGTKQQKLL